MVKMLKHKKSKRFNKKEVTQTKDYDENDIHILTPHEKVNSESEVTTNKDNKDRPRAKSKAMEMM